ncbi:tRNA (adenosine(37)-N6)-threonylcarbamoyltransferase complex ATPase subunit type 1 TsaE [Thalassotalea sp. LPB0316]|uniref:tRNA (adenosine(37)-N6)-threonylcarbamoyltransferase complex ATPase subunit type 1 TsaE n=1 Tax=Thalassotalea sp. LPB0316 TaxID=2769490 RepID=UPI001868B110|nr:tRNA (adenosine(37)-N6)-threonylcarbamoyltransferase complex ATPase subunit type 1 TsaE [Thalassotalea sp. LPB0316]QOL26530.1 tRNA (adenosine(37)-N6)-threonylcarbamoyltransferase complex ATPase subunit type 1 TsaE [Thalassotalea sp. LPB0316]
MNQYQATLIDEQATIALGSQLADIIKNELKHGVVVYLSGDLGAGKTTLTRGFVQGMGHCGHVKSPTYTLVEPYELPPWQVYHFDLYRLADPEELEYMGIRDYFNENSCSFIEWPSRGEGMIPTPDFLINLSYSGEQREVEIVPKSSLGDQLVAMLQG